MVGARNPRVAFETIGTAILNAAFGENQSKTVTRSRVNQSKVTYSVNDGRCVRHSGDKKRGFHDVPGGISAQGNPKASRSRPTRKQYDGELWFM